MGVTTAPVAADSMGSVEPADREFRLLGDQPYTFPGDPLRFEEMAVGLATLIMDSRRSTPLALGIESSWGMGKSTLMRQLERVFAEDRSVKTIWFNAWTATEGGALEGLVKSVLNKLDRNIVRRVLRDEKFMSWARALLQVVLAFLHMGGVVDAIWARMKDDPQIRNEARDIIIKSVQEWAGVDSDGAPRRLLVVFVDDLDRCSPVNVVQVLEAIKLYLDAAGMVFVIGYDPAVVSDAVLDFRQYSEPGSSYRYLEKIVQLVHRLPELGDDAADRLLDHYLDASGIEALFDGTIRGLVVQQNARNPRRIKRFINAFVLEYRLDADWRSLGPRALVRALVILVYFPEFGRMLRGDGENPVELFKLYVKARNSLRRKVEVSDAVAWEPVEKLLQTYGASAPTGNLNHQDLLDRIDQEVPAFFPTLARDGSFKSLIDSLEDVESLRAKLRRYAPAALRRPFSVPLAESSHVNLRLDVALSPGSLVFH